MERSEGAQNGEVGAEVSPFCEQTCEQMKDEATSLREQAAELEKLLPRLTRRLFSMEKDHAAEELPLAQLRVCSILMGGPRPLSAIGEELGISVSATTQIADRLEKACLVERVACQEDRRIKNLQLSTHGWEMMRTRRERRIERALQSLQKMSRRDRDEAMHLLHLLMSAVEDPTELKSEHE